MNFIIILFLSFTLVSCNENNPLLTREARSNKPRVITDEPECDEIRRRCNKLDTHDDILILECLDSVEPHVLDKLSLTCQKVVWHHTRKLIQNENIKSMLEPTCQNSLSGIHCALDDSIGSYLKCLVNNKESITDGNCVNSIQRLENIAFLDFRWTGSFLNSCTNDINRLRCERIDHEGMTQAKTVSCLQDQLSNISNECRKEVFKLAEIQSENIRYDRQLYLACAEDHSRFCRHTVPGSGRVLKCLAIAQQQNEKLTSECQTHLLRRQKLISQDYRISKGLMRACKDDIKKTHCRRQTSDDKSIRLAQVLLCLENIMKNGTKVDPDCEREMIDHRKVLLEDYRLSPEIVDHCAHEISSFCSGLDVGGKTIHCLMDHARLKNRKKKISDVCQRSLEDLVKQVDAGEDWRVDPVLHKACSPVVRSVCGDVQGGDARVMSCLMDNIGADHMTEDCENALMQIQYFVARDFKLDPQLYRNCKDDAVRLCHGTAWFDYLKNHDPETGPLVLPCLYRYAYHPDQNLQLKSSCVEQIRRVMRQRAASVDLHPEIEEPCLEDLALYCFDKVTKGEEMHCLQENMDELKENCKRAIFNFTEMEAEHAELNPYIMTHCKTALQTHCASKMKNDEGDIMECLIAHKNSPDVKSNNKCRVNIEHFQIISLKDYHFSYKFKIACKSYAIRFCREARTKAEVVACLSDKVRSDVTAGIKSDIQKECRQQLRAQMFQQRENIDFDPELKKACLSDIDRFCKNVEHGSAQVLECLQSTRIGLSESCQKQIFKVKKQEIQDNSVDYALITMCADAIEQFCPHSDRENVLECLKKNKNEKGFDKKCHLVVIHRMIEQNTNYNLNPQLQASCKLDIKKFCIHIVQEVKAESELNGQVIKCLKNEFRQSRLSSNCENVMANILRDQALDIQLNPLLKAVCKNELETICVQDSEEDSGNIEECLKNALLKKKIATPACQVEVASMIEESQADIQVDPPLQKACSVDLLKFCNTVPQGNGRHINCLKVIMADSSKQLTNECKSMLSKRLEMYKNAAALVPPADMQELYAQVVGSPSKHYFFFIIFCVFSSVFVIGIFCGRVTRRQRLSKMK